ncbi:hypothetical protein PHLGIDRAFT_388474 [Phlebiopsis gigantea 11061_1 CR5-6]|uniref:Uncharacterized protein n=1 Tax=Phlebiopsis gigantea (strain 11061_1 CR5-6) TaxID=745531 RepID=A0A0C3SBN6_PHLG1|nr:hypothetical protein PHLGIDRAFT_388474 [Phlebiopsis gigantea 11061_1 CR5-6]
MRESASAPLGSNVRDSVRPAAQADALKAAVQIQVQVEALANTAQAAAKQARLLTQYVGTLAEPGRDLAEAHRALQVTNMRLARDLANAREQGEAWKTLAQNVQEMQEMAMAAFERCNALEKENVELRHAMHAFAEGSASVTIQQLQRIISSLTEEVTQYKKREEDLKTKEKSLRSKENNVIIKAMRKQTKELKRRSLQSSKPTEVTVLGSKNINTLNADTPTANQQRNPPSPELTTIPSFQEIFFL